jgi:xanthine dehydrogenase accessory factor
MADKTVPGSRLAENWPAWPAYALIDDLLPVLERWVADRRRFALATLIEVIGSSPRPIGSEMAIADNGECAGYVSGGCVEAAVANEALAALADGRPRLLDYGAGSPVLDVQLSCGGRIRILVREIHDGAGYVARLREARRRRHTLWGLIHIATGTLTFEARHPQNVAADTYLHTYLPPLRLVLVGGDPIVMALLRLASTFGIETVLLRPLGPEQYAREEPEPVIYERRRLESALPEIALDARCAVYTLSHDADTDHAVLTWALRSPAFCVGALGSRGKAQMRCDRLRAEGFSEHQLARLHTPAGLTIRARTPQEIALSILGEVLAERPA